MYQDLQSYKSALLISFFYLAFGMAWIYFSDQAIELMAVNIYSDDTHKLSLWQTYKGFFYVGSTTLLLFWLTYRILHARHLAYLELKQHEALLHSIVESSPDAIYAKDIEGRYLLFSRGAADFAGISGEQVIGQSDSAIFPPETARKIRENDLSVLLSGKPMNQEETLLDAAGEEKIFWTTKGVLKTKEGSVFGIYGISRDITERKQTELAILEAKEKFDRLAHIDPLTSLPNRLSLIEFLHAKCSTREPFAFFFLDLDEFQTINDSYGHQFGDALLVKISEQLHRFFPEGSYIVRTGGDEFAIVLEHSPSGGLIARLMQQLHTFLSQPMHIDTVDLYVTASIGIALFPQDASSAEELLQNADAAMYDAKKRGKNTFSFYHLGLTEQALHRTTITADLQRALRHNVLTLHYQPQIDARSAEIIGFEALIRWISPEKVISPASFIPIAEETGLIHEVGEFVLREGCKTAVEWSRKSLLPGRIAINVSARQLIHPTFVDRLETIVRQAECRPEWLELEITESSILENPELVISILYILKKRGFHISIDDFGTGYSSLSYLRNLPVDKLKIDQSFIRDITELPKNQTIVKTIVSLASGLGMVSLAEGVETAEELEFLRSYGIDSVQGYYYYKPMGGSEAETLLRNDKSV